MRGGGLGYLWDTLYTETGLDSGRVGVGQPHSKTTVNKKFCITITFYNTLTFVVF